ncbi:heat shock protein HspQ [Nitrospina watsonii]|uniref:Heat shock protein HspQ n=1 Tax=Nitrospina watsonii TaxID=1323948 RepID=A0ABM9HEB2_9BACT|nr:heat shock protein HspQ [Nitrospina watsonii]CAI2718564.1 Heat shock protein HspQ [Nitrospina watsonii]
MNKSQPKYCIGQMIHHKLYDYHGVVLGVDAVFQLSEEWYQTMARSNPPKDQPWYHIKVHGEDSLRYVAERHLELDKNVFN